MDKSGQKLTRADKDGHKRTKMDKSGQKLTKADKNGHKRTKMDMMVAMAIMASGPEKDVGSRLPDCQIRNVSLSLHSYLVQTYGCRTK